MENIDLHACTSKALLDRYQNDSIDFKFEEKLRMGEIK